MSGSESTTDFSKKLAEKLLQGWAMLDSQCPRSTCSGIPLMRSKNRQKLYCVACETFYTEDGNQIQPTTPSQPGEPTRIGPGPCFSEKKALPASLAPSCTRASFHDLTAKLSSELDAPAEDIYLSALRSLYRQVSIHNRQIETAHEADDLRRALSCLESSLKSIQTIKKLLS